jgi:UDPglucose--hexose-1-phosphate uridylyltransferase
VPKRHHASFTEVGDAELQDFSELLGRSLQRIEAALQHPSYNFVIDSAPKSDIAAPHLHWRLRIVPETVTWGGFELGTGLPINPSIPEDDAAVLRAVALKRESAP